MVVEELTNPNPGPSCVSFLLTTTPLLQPLIAGGHRGLGSSWPDPSGPSCDD